MSTAEKAKSLFLDEACGDDVALRHRVEQLLVAHRALGTMPSPGAAATLAHRSADRTGTSIGPYRLLEQIGAGGMGQVFMAAQTTPVRRE
jgi:eukaryotic-like serine/threonine-protein kinase